MQVSGRGHRKVHEILSAAFALGSIFASCCWFCKRSFGWNQTSTQGTAGRDSRPIPRTLYDCSHLRAEEADGYQRFFLEQRQNMLRLKHPSVSPKKPFCTMSLSNSMLPPLKRSPKALPRSSATCAATSMPTSSISVAAPTGKPKAVEMVSIFFGSMPSCRNRRGSNGISGRVSETSVGQKSLTHLGHGLQPVPLAI